MNHKECQEHIDESRAKLEKAHQKMDEAIQLVKKFSAKYNGTGKSKMKENYHGRRKEAAATGS